jgi:hypothetical protein
MKGIYLTEEDKLELEDKISEIEKVNKLAGELANTALVNAYKEILSSATILPVEKSYNDIQHFETSEHGTIIRKHFLMANYSNGIIIQPK